MASASTTQSFYCHQCQRGIVPNLDNFTCPSCNGGFIEQVNESIPSTRRQSNQIPPFFDIIHSIQERGYPQLNDFYGDSDEDMIDDQADNQLYAGPITRSRINRTRNDAPQALPVSTYRRRRSNGMSSQLPTMFYHFPLESMGGTGGLHGADFFDIIISHFMNAIPSGPPPASETDIAHLSRIHLTEQDRKIHEKCSVCFEDYAENEKCVKLQCQHVFHEPCITTWLKQHATCPVCRKDLQGRDPVSNDNDDDFTAGGPPRMNPPPPSQNNGRTGGGNSMFF